MSYSNKYDATPICRTHARNLCDVRTPKFSSDNACDKIVACRTHARVVASCAFTPLYLCRFILTLKCFFDIYAAQCLNFDSKLEKGASEKISMSAVPMSR